MSRVLAGLTCCSHEILKSYKPRASIFPGVLDYTDCPYSWPFCHQPLYAGAMPVIFNATILNGMGVIGFVESPPTRHPSNHEGNLLSIQFTYSDVIWPWSGYLALHMQIKEEGAQFSGEIEGNITVKIYSPPAVGEKSQRSSTCVLHLKLQVIPTPPRSARILWDQFHSIKYPPGYIPIDSFDVGNDLLEWHGDHVHTNFHSLFDMLRDVGYYIETLGSPLTCFDANQYRTLLLVDLEDEYFPEEIKKLRDDVINSGLGLAVFAEWYNVDAVVKIMRFFDGTTHSWWIHWFKKHDALTLGSILSHHYTLSLNLPSAHSSRSVPFPPSPESPSSKIFFRRSPSPAPISLSSQRIIFSFKDFSENRFVAFSIFAKIRSSEEAPLVNRVRDFDGMEGCFGALVTFRKT